MHRALRLSTVAAASLLAAASASASFEADAQNDFLPSYTGVHAGDLDVLFAYGVWNPQTQLFSFGGTMSSPIGTTTGAVYVWGIDRGAGTERFVSGSPSVGQGVFFDSIISLNPTTQAYVVNLLNGTTFALAASAVVISGNTITVNVSAANLPGTGRSFDQYGWNLWPRGPGISGNAAISDFAPDASTPRVVSVVPEPASVAMLLAGALAVFGIARRRSA